MSSISFFFEETRKRIRALFRAVGVVGEFCETWSALELYRRSAFQFVSTPYLAVDCASKQNSMALTTEFDVDSIIDKLLEVRGARPGKEVNLPEEQIKQLITKATDIFMSQPVLLNLQAPIKVCGMCFARYLKIRRYSRSIL